MDKLDGGIHRRLSAIIHRAGGYDYKFHAKKIAEQLNLPVEGVTRIMELSDCTNHNKANHLFNQYIRAYQDGVPLSKIEQAEIARIERVTQALFTKASALI